MQQKTRLFSVNLQEGFIVDAESNTIYAAYNHNHKAIATIAPWNRNDFSIPSALKGYKIHNRLVGGFSITGWTQTGYVQMSDLVRSLSKKEEFFEQLKAKLI